MGMALLKSLIPAWPAQPCRDRKQDSKTFRVTTLKCTSLLKRWGRCERYSRVVSCSTRNIWTAWKLDVLPQLQIGQHLLKLKMMEQKSFSQTVTLKLHSLLLRNSEFCADWYFLKLMNSLKKHTPGKGKGNKTVSSPDSVRCILCTNPPLTGCVRDLCPRFWKAQLILTTLHKAGQRSQWKQTVTKCNRRQKRDKTPEGFWSFQKCTQCWSSLALVRLPIRGRNAWLYSQCLETVSHSIWLYKAGTVT